MPNTLSQRVVRSYAEYLGNPKYEFDIDSTGDISGRTAEDIYFKFNFLKGKTIKLDRSNKCFFVDALNYKEGSELLDQVFEFVFKPVNN